jgi:hypothetical protein
MTNVTILKAIIVRAGKTDSGHHQFGDILVGAGAQLFSCSGLKF